MDQKTVEILESKLEDKIAEVIQGLDVKKLPMLPTRRTIHLMAKAAVTVYEASVDNHNSAFSRD